MNDELKPCPFCGGDFYFHEIEETGIEVRHNPIGDCPIEPLLGWYYTKEIALKTLNTRPLEASLRSQLAEAQAEIKRLTEWIPVSERLPELNEVQWSENVQLAYKTIGCEYKGQQCASRYYFDISHTKTFQWEYGVTGTLEGMGYEAVAWKPLLEYVP